MPGPGQYNVRPVDLVNQRLPNQPRVPRVSQEGRIHPEIVENIAFSQGRDVFVLLLSTPAAADGVLLSTEIIGKYICQG